VLEALLKSDKFAKGVSGKEALIQAIISKPLDTVQLFLDCPHIHGTITDETLEYAVDCGQPEVLEALLDSDKFAEGVSGKEALIYAVQRGRKATVIAFLNSKLGEKIITDETLTYAVNHVQPGVLEALLASDKLAEGVSGTEAFSYAVQRGRKAAAMALLNSKLGEKINTEEMKPMVEKLLGEEVNLA
jgi:hypothetical protein